MVQMCFDISNRLGVNYGCDRHTDGWTDRTAVSNSSLRSNDAR